MNRFKGTIAIFALTQTGCELAWKIGSSLPGSALFFPEKFNAGFADARLFPPMGFSAILSENWRRFDGHVFVMATGIVVRKLVPLLVHKTKDPAVVVCDEGAQFAISLLSGHIGGANRLSRDIADITGAQAVITTATDVQDIMAFDELASINDWTVTNPEVIKQLNTLLLEKGRIGVLIPEALFSEHYSEKDNVSLLSAETELNDQRFDGFVVLNPKQDPKIFTEKPVLVLKHEE